jgi:methionine biosynthesis protein MetW
MLGSKMCLQNLEDLRWIDRSNWINQWHLLACQLVVNEPVLDLGGGDGTFATLLREKRGIKHVTIGDISRVAIEKAINKCFDAKVVDLNKLPLPFEDKSFATVTLIEVLEHLYDPVSVLKECKRIATQDIVFTVPNFNYMKYRLQMLVGKVPDVMKPKHRHVYWFNRSILATVLSESGLQVETVLFVTPLSLNPKLMQFLGRNMPSLFAADYVVKCKVG